MTFNRLYMSFVTVSTILSASAFAAAPQPLAAAQVLAAPSASAESQAAAAPRVVRQHRVRRVRAKESSAVQQQVQQQSQLPSQHQETGDIRFEEQGSTGPVRFTIVKSDGCGQNICFLEDRAGVRRLTLNLNYKTYEIENSRGVVVSKRTFQGNDEFLNTARKLVAVSESCPADVEVNRETLSIEKVTSPCAPKGPIVEWTFVRRDDCGQNSCYLYEAGKTERSMTYSTVYRTYQFGNGGVLPMKGELTEEEAAKFQSYVFNVSPSCPLKVQFNYEIGKIVKAKLGCDPLALGPSDRALGR